MPGLVHMPLSRIGVLENVYTSALYHTYPPAASLSLEQQLSLQLLICPFTKKTLHFNQSRTSLVTEDGTGQYPLKKGVPWLLRDENFAKKYIEQSQVMIAEYSESASPKTFDRIKQKILTILNKTWQTPQSARAHAQTYNIPSDGVCLAIGGGPSRTHPKAINVNIGQFENVDIVADANDLPYRTDSVDAIVCEDVLEHLQHADAVIQEFHRILKPGGVVFSTTPFLISYHGYPNHYQNFTGQGHADLYARNGFANPEMGVCMGPWTAFLNLIGFLLSVYTPSALGLKKIFCRSWTLACFFLKPLDRLFQANEQALVSCHSSYVLCRKT